MLMAVVARKVGAGAKAAADPIRARVITFCSIRDEERSNVTSGCVRIRQSVIKFQCKHRISSLIRQLVSHAAILLSHKRSRHILKTCCLFIMLAIGASTLTENIFEITIVLKFMESLHSLDCMLSREEEKEIFFSVFLVLVTCLLISNVFLRCTRRLCFHSMIVHGGVRGV